MQLPFEKLQRDMLVRRDAKSSPKYGCDPFKRPIEELIKYGIINIDKPRGPTSHQVSAYVKNILGIEKCGHSGTLDPNVTGVLPVALSRATKVVQALLVSGKEYVCIMHLHDERDEESIKETSHKFIGKIKQLPPVRSAIKREIRTRKIYYLDIKEIKDRDVLYTVGCQAGTYIRKLCHDWGLELGTAAHMAELRRTKAGPYTEDSLATLHDLQDAMHYYKEEKNEKPLRKLLQPMETGVQHLGKVYVTDSAVDSICHGANLNVPGIAKVESDIMNDDQIAVMTLKGELIALGKAKKTSKDMVKAPKGLAVDIEKVFMEPGIYPKLKRAD